MIDCHCHLADQRIFPSIDAVIAESQKKGLHFFIMGGVSPEEWQRQKIIQAKLPSVVTCFGLHPVWVAEQTDARVDQAFSQLNLEISQAAAIGETGLDFRKAYRDPSQKERQERLFRSHLELAAAVKKPLVLHVVQAQEAALKIAADYGSRLPAGRFAGMVHGFTGSREVARQWLDLGFLISLGTRILFKQNQKLKDLAAWLPADRLLVESDAPDQRPPDHPGALNEPWTSMQVIAMIAAAKNMDAGALQDQLLINAGSLFGREFRRGKPASS